MYVAFRKFTYVLSISSLPHLSWEISISLPEHVLLQNHRASQDNELLISPVCKITNDILNSWAVFVVDCWWVIACGMHCIGNPGNIVGLGNWNSGRASKMPTKKSSCIFWPLTSSGFGACGWLVVPSASWSNLDRWTTQTARYINLHTNRRPFVKDNGCFRQHVLLACGTKPQFNQLHQNS